MPSNHAHARSVSKTLLLWIAPVLVASVALVAVGCSAFEGSADDSTAPSGTSSMPGWGGAAEESAGRGDLDMGESGGMDGSFGVTSPGAAPAPMTPGGGGSGNNVPALQGTLDRTIIRNGSVAIEVESVADSFERVRQIAEGAGGFVAESSFTGSGDSQSASLTLRVPAARFGDVVAELQGMALEVRNVTSSSQDVTEEFTDLEASLRNLRAVEQQYLTLLSRAEAIEDILLVQDRLNGVRYEIERVQGRLNLLENLTSLATIRVSLSPDDGAVTRVEGGSGFTERISEAWESSLDAIATVGTTIAVALVWSWWLLPVLVVLAWLVRRYAVRTGRGAGARVDTPEGAA